MTFQNVDINGFSTEYISKFLLIPFFFTNLMIDLRTNGDKFEKNVFSTIISYFSDYLKHISKTIQYAQNASNYFIPAREKCVFRSNN